MATMIPADIEVFTTAGEKSFYRFLQVVGISGDTTLN